MQTKTINIISFLIGILSTLSFLMFSKKMIQYIYSLPYDIRLGVSFIYSAISLLLLFLILKKPKEE